MQQAVDINEASVVEGEPGELLLIWSGLLALVLVTGAVTAFLGETTPEARAPAETAAISLDGQP